MNRCIIYNYSNAITEKLSGYRLIPRVKQLEDIDTAAADARKQNNVFCIWADCSLMSVSDMKWDCIHTDLPIILYAYSLGDTFKTLCGIEMLRRLNIRIFLSSTCEENYHAIKMLSSLGIETGILMDARHINDDSFMDLASYAMLGQMPHSSIEPFDYIWRNLKVDENLDLQTTYFDNPSKYIYINDNLDFAFSEEDLDSNKFAGNLINVKNIEFENETATKLQRYYSHFIALDECSKCPSFRICNRISQSRFKDCTNVFATIFEYAEIKSDSQQEHQNRNARQICQL